MGCGTSRSPARVGVIVEDEASLYQGKVYHNSQTNTYIFLPLILEFFPTVDDGCWVGESARDASSSFCNSSSPPPYTPLPLSGHVTLMLGQDSSPAKRQDSLRSSTRSERDLYPREQDSTQHQVDVSGSILESSFRRERIGSATSRHHSRDVVVGEMEMSAPEVSRQPSADMSSTQVIEFEPTRTADETVESHDSLSSPFPTDQLLPRPPRLDILSSSFPSARPPSPFPRSRSLSFQLPPLRTIQQPPPPDEPQLPPPPDLLQQPAPFRLPPLRELPPLDGETHQRSRKRSRGRSNSCQLQTSSLLTSLQEQSVTVIQ